jgi:hypothetical protein
MRVEVKRGRGEREREWRGKTSRGKKEKRSEKNIENW